MNSGLRPRHKYCDLIGRRRAEVLPLSLYPWQTLQLLRLDYGSTLNKVSKAQVCKVVIKRGQALKIRVKGRKDGETLLARLADEMVKLGASSVPAGSTPELGATTSIVTVSGDKQ